MKDGYTIVSDNLCAIVGADAAIIAGKVVSMCGDSEQCEISLKYLADILGVSIDQVRRYINKLHTLGYIEYIPRNGRGFLPIFKKGANMLPFIAEKGCKNAAKKVAKMQPNNINNNIVCLDNAHAHISNKQNKQTEKEMDSFDIFWQAFFFGSYAQYEREQNAYKERARAVWAMMSDAAKEACIKELRNGKRYDKTTYVVFYLQNYEAGVRKGTRLTRDQYYAKFGDDLPREGWRFYKPEGYERFIYEKL